MKIQAGGDPDPYEPYGPPYGHKLDNQAGSLPSTIQAGGVFNFGDDAAKRGRSWRNAARPSAKTR